MRYMKCATSLVEVDDALRWASLQVATAGSAKKENEVWREGGYTDAVVSSQQFGAVLYQSFVSKVHAGRTKTAVLSLTTEGPWSRDLLYNTRIH